VPATVAYRQVAFFVGGQTQICLGDHRCEHTRGLPVVNRTGGFVSVATEKAMEKSSEFQLPRESLQRTKKLYIAPLVSPVTSVEWEVPPVVAKR
jgi:hypothetical protein